MIEIERKFLVKDDSWRKEATHSIEIFQGYFHLAGEGAVRVRIIGEDANLNIKGKADGIARKEFEYKIPVCEAKELLELFCKDRTVAKTRYFVPAKEGLVWEIDEYHGPFQGHFTAELEIPTPDFSFESPLWLGDEKSDDHRFANAALALAQKWPENDK